MIMIMSMVFQERIRSTLSTYRLRQELDTIRRIVIDESSPLKRDELCTKQRYIQERLFELELGKRMH